MTITVSGGTTYEAGDVLTCSADGNNPTYAWSGTNGGSSFSSTLSTVTLEAGQFCLNCTATVNSDPQCSASASRCDIAYGKYQKENNTLVTFFRVDDTFCMLAWPTITVLKGYFVASKHIIGIFLQRVSIACYAERCISYDRFCLTV